MHLASTGSRRRVVRMRAGGHIAVDEELVRQFKQNHAGSPSSSMISMLFSSLTSSLSSSSSSSSSLSSGSDRSSDESHRHQHWLVHVKGPVTPAMRSELAEMAGHDAFLKALYVPHDTLLVLDSAPASAVAFQQRVAKHPAVLYVTELLPEHKFEERLVEEDTVLDMIRESRARSSQTSTSASIVLPLTLHLGSAKLASRHPSSDTVRRQLQRALDDHLRAAGGPVRSADTSVINEHWLRVNVHVDSSPANQNKDADQQQLAAQLTPTFASIVRDVLTQHALVHWVERRRQHSIANKWARFIVQSDAMNDTDVWDHGVTGSGEVIAVGDTGVDHDSCFFHDPDEKIVFSADAANFRHRKIVQYVGGSWGDNQDMVGGHGTHVAGSIAGHVLTDNAESRESLSPFNGMAPDAKLAVYDFQGTMMSRDDLQVPDDLYHSYFLTAYTVARARLSSNSWGNPDGSYDQFSLDTDRFAYKYKEFLPIFAAGNYGEESGFHSITSPGVCKNSLVVTSVRSATDSFVSMGLVGGIGVTVRASGNSTTPDDAEAATEEYVFAVALADFGPSYMKMTPFRNVSAVYIGYACVESGLSDLTGKVAVAMRGSCHFTSKAEVAAKLHALLLIVINDSPGYPIVMGGSGEHIPGIMVSDDDGKKLRELMESSPQSLSVTLHGPEPVPDSAHYENYLSSFASRGPTFDGRIKPDVAAPGEFIQSALSDGRTNSFQCGNADNGLVRMQGTSMATPVVAGSAALVREWFAKGYYPTGRPTEANAIKASAALVKAMLIQSGAPVGGSVLDKSKGSLGKQQQVEPEPSRFQGYGRVLLDNVLQFRAADDDGDSNSNDKDNGGVLESGPRSLFVQQAAAPMESMDEHFYCFRMPAGSTEQFRATIVWTDPPPSMTAEMQLVNNLDLSASVRSGDVNNKEALKLTKFLGNNLHYSDPWGGTKHYVVDVINNVEQVTVPPSSFVESSPSPSMVSLRVVAQHVPSGTQEYALVASGEFEVVDNTECAGVSACPKNCTDARHGHCLPTGKCECVHNYGGVDCSVRSSPLLSVRGAQELTHKWSHVGQVQSEGWEYFHLDLTQQLLDSVRTNASLAYGLYWTMPRMSMSGDPDYFMVFGREYPTRATHQWSSTVCDGCGEKSAITIKPDELKAGRYTLGVFGYCCSQTTYRVNAELKQYVAPRDDRTTQSNDHPAGSNYALVVLLAVVLIVIGVFVGDRLRRRGQSPQPAAVPVQLGTVVTGVPVYAVAVNQQPHAQMQPQQQQQQQQQQQPPPPPTPPPPTMVQPTLVEAKSETGSQKSGSKKKRKRAKKRVRKTKPASASSSSDAEYHKVEAVEPSDDDNDDDDYDNYAGDGDVHHRAGEEHHSDEERQALV